MKTNNFFNWCIIFVCLFFQAKLTVWQMLQQKYWPPTLTEFSFSFYVKKFTLNSTQCSQINEFNRNYFDLFITIYKTQISISLNKPNNFEKKYSACVDVLIWRVSYVWYDVWIYTGKILSTDYWPHWDSLLNFKVI